MEILINGRAVEYTLGDERTVGDVLDGLAKWAAGRGEVVLGVTVDGAEVHAPATETVRGRPIGAVRRIEVETSDVKVLVVETLREVKEYAERASALLPEVADEVARTGGSERLDQFIEALPWLERVFERLEELLRVDFAGVRAAGRPVRDILEALKALRPSLEAADAAARAAILRGPAVEALAGLAAAIPAVLDLVSAATGPTSPTAREIGEEIAEVLDDVRRLPGRLEEIAVQIQIGDDAAGMGRFADEIRLLERAFRLAERGRTALGLAPDEIVVGGEDWGSRADKITALLEELLGAFERGDKVLVGDLLEYELSPAGEALVAALEEVLRRIEARPS